MTDRKTGRLSTFGGVGTLYKSRGRYYGRVTVNGRRITVSTHCTRREDAERFIDEYTFPLRAGNDKARLEHLAAEIRCIDADIEEMKRRATDYQITDLFHRMIASRPLSKSTKIDYRAALGALCRFVEVQHPGIERMSQITNDAALEFRDYLVERVKTGTVNLYLGKLKAVWTSLAEGAGLQNPWRRLKVVGRSTPRMDLTEDEFKSVMDEARKTGGDVAYMFELASSTAMRMSDCCLLKWSNIDMGRRTITFVPQKLRRTGKTVQIPMSRSVQDLLTARAEGGTQRGFVAPKLASAWSCNFAQRRARRVFTAAGIPPKSGKSFHSLRVHAITKMLESGIPLATVQSLVGHASPEMTQHYYRCDLDRAREAIDRLSTANGHGETEKPPTRTTGGGDIITLLGTLTTEQRAALKSLL
mgnify:CR=1 FL=1